MKRVVVVGGGVAGVHVARSLQCEAIVTIVDPKDYFEIPYAGLRNIVEPAFAERSIVLYSDFLAQTRLVTSSAVSASPTEVTTEDGQRIPYDFLVICTGSIFRGARSRQLRIQEFHSDHERLKAAHSVLIIGGGPVGVELAGEIVTDFPDKQVVLVQSGNRLLEFMGPSTSAKTLEWLRCKSVDVILNEKIDLAASSSPVYTTSSGRQIQADSHFLCTGSKVNSSWLKDGFLASKVDDEGRLAVEPSLLVGGTGNVFAAGDITNLKEIKQGFLAERHARTIASNIKKLMAAKSDQLSAYKPLSEPMGAVSLGRCSAVVQLPVVGSFVGWLPGLLKSKDLFVGKTRKGLGLAN